LLFLSEPRLARFQFAFLFGEIFLCFGLAVRRQALLYLPLNFSVSFFLGLLFLTGTKYCEVNN
jgi:hypothetical protein